MITKRLVVAGMLAVGVFGCGNTRVLDSWKATDVAPASAKRIVVVGLSGDDITRRLFEDTFSDELRRRGNDAVAGHTFLPNEPEANADSALAVLKANPGLSWVSYSDENGTFTGANRTPEESLQEK